MVKIQLVSDAGSEVVSWAIASRRRGNACDAIKDYGDRADYTTLHYTIMMRHNLMWEIMRTEESGVAVTVH